MHGFLLLSCMFVASMVLVIVYVANGQPAEAVLPLVGALVTGCGIARMVAVPEHYRQRQRDIFE